VATTLAPWALPHDVVVVVAFVVAVIAGVLAWQRPELEAQLFGRLTVNIVATATAGLLGLWSFVVNVVQAPDRLDGSDRLDVGTATLRFVAVQAAIVGGLMLASLGATEFVRILALRRSEH